MSKQILLTSEGKTNTSDFTVSFPYPIEMNGLTYECAMSRLDTYFSYYNVTNVRQNSNFSYNNGVHDIGLIIPDGLYSMENLIKKIHDGMKTGGDYTVVDGVDIFSINFYPNIANGHIDMVLKDSFKVDFTDNNMRLLFGFNSALYVASATSESKSDINYSVSKILVHCSLVSGSSFLNGNVTDVIYSFSPSYQENEKISIENTGGNYLKVNDNRQINNIRIYLSDQNLRPIYFNQAPVSIELHLKPHFLVYK